MEHINDLYARYADENHDLAISLTARELGLEECSVREAIESGRIRNFSGPHPQMRPTRSDALRWIPAREMTLCPTRG